VARHLGTEHHEMRVSAQMAQDVIPRLPHMYDEPFADSSQIPTHLVCQAARQQVTVALSGDAGDELFGGYNRYFWGPRHLARLVAAHAGTQMLHARPLMPISGLGRRGQGGWDALAPTAGTPGGQAAQAGTRACRPCAAWTTCTAAWCLNGRTRPHGAGRRWAAGERAEPVCWTTPCLRRASEALTQLRMMYRDAMSYLPDDILCKVDRAAMACSLETRVPFLDHRVAELAWRLPLHMKVAATPASGRCARCCTSTCRAS
jgi:asparagine synthase (glutamine-hydrolysing)